MCVTHKAVGQALPAAMRHQRNHHCRSRYVRMLMCRDPFIFAVVMIAVLCSVPAVHGSAAATASAIIRIARSGKPLSFRIDYYL